MLEDSFVRQVYNEGSLKWPSLTVPLETFQRHCAQAWNGEAPNLDGGPNAADLYLCCACAIRDRSAQRLLEREASGLVRAAIAHVCHEPEFVSETVQEFWNKLLAGTHPKVLDYRGCGPLLAWLRIAATRIALDRRRAANRLAIREVELDEYLVECNMGPESALTRARFRAVFEESLQKAFAQLSQKERNLLRMHVIGRCSIDQIGRTYRVHRATAARWLQQTRERVWRIVRRELELAGETLTDSEFKSVARVVGPDVALELAPASSSAEPSNHESSPAR